MPLKKKRIENKEIDTIENIEENSLVVSMHISSNFKMTSICKKKIYANNPQLNKKI
jgi:hypothetical protein